jgi:TetR/AcrR family transcriptional regulator, lmrAB and yxaGH operons repressor
MPAALNPEEKQEIVDRLFQTFRDRGYEASSLAVLSEATGLGKSSLYHHFPKGKEQMAEAVLAQGKTFMENAVVEVAQSPEPLKARLRKVIAAFDTLYDGGRNHCIIGRLSGEAIGPAARQTVQEIVASWIDAVALLAREGGLSPSRARHFAEDWFTRVQGSLILHAATGDTEPYKRTMNALMELSKEKPSPRKDT